jgi:hypothetical protein
MLIRSKRAASLAAFAGVLFSFLGLSGTSHGAPNPHPPTRVDEPSVEGADDANVPRLHALVHVVSGPHETWKSIAETYLDRTDIYDVDDLARAIARENSSPGGPAHHGMKEGVEIKIPHVLPAPPKNTRLGLPADKEIRGIYVRGDTAARRTYPALLERMVAHGMNAIVLDVKDYDGSLTYASKVPLAIESGATKKASIRSYARAVQFAHRKGIRVIARVSCFEDELQSRLHPRTMGIRGKLGGLFRNGWLDPKSPEAQNYTLALVREVVDFGVDEIQLDYVRYPVTKIKNADFGLDKHNPRAKVEVITNFVERAHAITKAHGVPLSLDVFGVIALGRRVDIDNLGQDPPELAKHAEFLSPMVYPSHYDPGFLGYDAPGDHPELVGLGVKNIKETIAEGGVSGGAKIRPWLQAMRHKSSTYGTDYIQREIKTGSDAGATGYLLWNPGQNYEISWKAVPRKTGIERASFRHRARH